MKIHKFSPCENFHIVTLVNKKRKTFEGKNPVKQRFFMLHVNFCDLINQYNNIGLQEAEIAASLDSITATNTQLSQKRGSAILNLKCSDVQVAKI